MPSRRDNTSLSQDMDVIVNFVHVPNNNIASFVIVYKRLLLLHHTLAKNNLIR